MSLLTRVLNVFRAGALEQEFDDELRFHLEKRVARNREQGMIQAEAERAAHERFGSLDRAKDQMREIRMLNRQFVTGLMAGLLLAGIPAGLLWLRASKQIQPAPQDLGFHAQADASTICGTDVLGPSVLPPIGTGPVVYVLGLCFPGNRSRIPPLTYLRDIQLRLSRPSQRVWAPYDASAEEAILMDSRRLWANHALADLSVEVRDYRFSNGVVGKLVTYNIKERN